MKKSQIEKAIDELEGEITVLTMAVAKLREQQQQASVRRPRAVTDAKSA